MGDPKEYSGNLPMKMGPVRVVEVFTWEPKDHKATECLGCDSVPFQQVKHLCSDKPLLRFPPGDYPH